MASSAVLQVEKQVRPDQLSLDKSVCDYSNGQSNGTSSSTPSVYGTPETLRSSSMSSGTTITSSIFQQMHKANGISLDLGSEKENVADIFNRSNDIYYDTETGDSPVAEVASTSEWSCDPSVGITLNVGNRGASAEPPQTVLDIFHETLLCYGDNLALAVKRAGQWQQWTYNDYYHESIAVAKALIKLGLEPAHGVCVIGFNAPEWHITNMATIMAGGILVGMYVTSTTESCCFVANSCKANIIVVENDSQLLKILQIRPRLTHLKAIIFYNKIMCQKEEGVYEWNEILSMKTDMFDEELKTRMELLSPNKCCSIVYTSGTSGNPKGVMLSHDNLTWMCRRVLAEAKISLGEERIVSYLPLSHIAAQLLDIYSMLSCGGSCWFAQPDALKGSLLHTLREVHPTMFLGVPRVWDKIAESMQLVAMHTTGLKAKISQWAKGVGLKGNYKKQTGKSGTPLGWSLANAIFFKKVRKALGLDKCHFSMGGSAPLSEDTLSYFMSVNIPIHELYGMSETTGPTTVSTVDNVRFRSSGRGFDGVELMISEPDECGNGEILVRGRHIFMGYIGDPRATRDTFTDDGWLKTGDIGCISHEGFLYITGRAKELIVTALGDNVPPVPIESAIKQELPIVSNVVVIGEQKRFLTCLITFKVILDDETGQPTDRLNPMAMAYCENLGSSATTVSDIVCGEGDPRVLNAIQNAINKVNRHASCKQHKVAKWSILEKDFTIATGELTHTMKLKRRYIALKYADVIESLYM